MNKTDLSAYLTKLGLPSELPADLESLHRIHVAQHRCLPFENFDIALQRGVSVEIEDIIQKTVYHSRGGYCFELNGLMLDVLNTLGFEARSLLGRVHVSGTPTGRSHQITLVTLEEQTWIVDVGFGSNTPRAPLPFILDQVIQTDLQTFRFVKDAQFGYFLQVLSTDGTDTWNNLYSFDLEFVFAGDIACSNFFTSTSPNSRFTSARVAARATESGLVTLLNYTLRCANHEALTEIDLEPGQTYLDALKEYFGIELDAQYDELRPLPDA
ncbi:arylamine N-acetyltransferase [Vibrio alginolyticus]|nr:arylamine N-acetyltransferase [Vibrio alginolyticus]ELB2927513.1 arylamine N-acetyltransferase [Vibrio alginolyticus]